MAIEIHEVRSTLNDLIETCKDSEEGYKIAAEKVSDPDVRTLFLKSSRQRSQFAGELQAEIVTLGGEPATAGSVGGAIHRGWIGLKSAVTVEHDVTVLEEVERGEDSALKNYHEALEKDLPANLRVIVERQYWEIRKTHDNVRALRASHWKMEVPMAGLV
ncbi:MAG TPA: PA2169 family four-helix-bundle protein [Bryobacteraceae bacterium]|nr:PA2169 family four-helix-bundle protein [Bryobacteraceae bacterium]